ncbi:AMP-dependent synthetase/ligase [Piscinibacter sakaiensis]|uniref:AMP-dependent synthetase/ligase n=1 Tax=Piscinibacter sakaiensis TaxID=1547922 RepID=UPI003AAC5363
MQRDQSTLAAEPASQWDLGAETTLMRLLAINARAYPKRTAMREKALGIWQEFSWSQILDEVLAIAAGLEQLGFGENDALLVLGDNRVRLYLGMLAAAGLKGYAMPVYPDAIPDEVRHFASEAQARYALAEDQEQVDKLLDLRDKAPSLAHIVFDDPRGVSSYDAEGLISWDDLRAAGMRRLEAEAGLRESLITRSVPDGPAVFVHSSGTTGKPKGVVLQNRNVLAGVGNACRGNVFGFDEEILAYLPMAWIGDFAVTMAAGIALRFVINIPERQETVLRNLREVAPTVYLAAPRSWDNMLTTIRVRMEDSTPLKKRIFNHFIELGVAVQRLKLEGKTPSAMQQLRYRVGEILVYAPLKDQFGLNRMRTALTGGEAMGEDTFLFYRALGINLRQLYGQTESSAFNSVQAPDEVQLHTVGRPLPGVEAKIADDGEILLRSGSIFSGYFNNEESTRQTLIDGWLHTGDAGYIEPDGHLVVLGRVAEVVHTAQGERYIPNYIENRIKFSPYIRDVAVLGAGRDTLAAIVCIDLESVGHWAEVRGIPYISYADLSQNEQVRELVLTEIRRVNRVLPEPLQIRRFVDLHKEFDPDDGEITRTRKLRRNVIEDRYKAIIDALYSDAESVVMKAQITYDSGDIGVIERKLVVGNV